MQRHAIFSRLPLPALSAGAHEPQLPVRHVPANPSSYAYLSPRRWKGLEVGPGRLVRPDAATRARCPDYDAWHFGLSSRLPPFVQRTPGGVSAAVSRFARRDVVYLQGFNDTCESPGSSHSHHCESHGLEVKCADELMGRYRLQRGQLYFAHLETHFGRPVHAMREVANVGHDHTQIWQSAAGLQALFGVQ